MNKPYSREERTADLAYIEDLREEVEQLYKRLFILNVGGKFHAFLEWCGVMSEHLNICEDMIRNGAPAFSMNRHTGSTPPIPPYRVTYMGEKLECIFDGLIKIETDNTENSVSHLEAKRNDGRRAYKAVDDLSLLPRRTQTQRVLDDQLRDLSVIANRLVLYDAADFLRDKVNR